MKKIISLMLALALALTLAACGEKKPEAPLRHTVRIGVLEPLTGKCTPEGRRELLGVRYAHSLTPSLTLNREEYDMELVVADCGSTVQSAIEAAAYLVEQDVCVVIGAYDSELSLAVGPMFEENGIALIGVGCTGDALTGYARDCGLLTVSKKSGTGIIFVNPHLGSWEASGIMVPVYGDAELAAVRRDAEALAEDAED